ncbi:MAG: class I SAM-dependent methyltransferase [Magnetococcales bacterium]|nr:class I SAM-dependent methyltransferase [Magnetococcales bacterium]NGZ25588.1 class I SAM-dependent methyltransferase [Magnetococcales bacterium]
MANDKDVERIRYDERARKLLLNSEGISSPSPYGVALEYEAPYHYYKEKISANLDPNHFVLEIGAGTGTFTGFILASGARLCALDISAACLDVLELRFQGQGRFEIRVADMEVLPFADELFDVVTCAGSLSYGDNTLVMEEIHRVLKPGGVFICVDSLDHNLIYRLNRWIHYLTGNRTFSTLQRMPTISLIERYGRRFGSVEVRYFGMVSWLMPVIVFLFGGKFASRLSDWVDGVFGVHKSAFKFVMVATRVRNESPEKSHLDGT